MNKYVKCLLIAVGIIVITIGMYYFVVIDGYPFGKEQRLADYYCTLMIVKSILVIGATIAISVSSAIIIRE